MKTSDSIEAQEERKHARDNGGSSPASRQLAGKKSGRGDASRIAPWRFKPGQSGNPSGKRKYDLAAELARAVFENNLEGLYQTYSKAALRGNGYVFKELADRGYGRLKERVELEVGPYRDVPTEDLEKQIRQLEEQLGYVRREEPSQPAVLPPASDGSNSKPN